MTAAAIAISAKEPISETIAAECAGRRDVLLFIVLGLFAVFVVWCSLPAFTYSAPPQDEGLLLVYPERILQGQVPSRDFRCSYGPANFYFIAGCYRLFGASVNTERGVGLLYRLMLITGFGALAGRRGAMVGLLAAGLAWCMTLALGLGAYSWFGAVACLVWSLWMGSESFFRTRLTEQAATFTSGLLVGIAVLYRPDIIFIAALCAVPIFTAPGASRRGAYASGIGVGIGLFAAYLVAASPGAVIGNLANAVLTSRNMRLTKGPSTGDETRLIILLTIAAVSTFGVAVYQAWRRRRFSTWRLQLSVAFLSLGVLQQVLGYPDLFHIMYAGCVILGLWPGAIAAALNLGRARLNIRQQIIVSAIVILSVGLMTGKSLAWPAGRTIKVALGLVHYDRLVVVNHGRTLPVAGENERRDMQSLVDEVNQVAVAGDSLVVGPKDLKGTPLGSTYLYFILPQLVPATYHLEVFPGTTTGRGPGSNFYRDISQSRVVILDTRWDNPQAALERASEAEKAVNPLTGFALRGRYGPFELYLRRP